MSPNDQKSGREEKLAAKLRENLKRRKVQARAQSGSRSSEDGVQDSGGKNAGLPNGESNG